MSVSVSLKPIKGDQFKVEVEESGKVSDLKKKIAEAKEEFPVESQKLILAGKILGDDTPISELNLKPESFIVVMSAGAKKAAAPAAATPAATPAAAPAAAPAAGAPAATPAPQATPDAAATTPAARAPLPAIITDLKSNPKYPELARVVPTDASVLNRCLRALGPWPELREAIINNLQGFVLMCRDDSGVGHGDPLPSVQRGPGPGGNPAQGAALMAALQQNPELMQQMLASLPPEMRQMAQQNPQAFAQGLAQLAGEGGLPGMGGGPGMGAPGGMPVPAELTEADNAAVERLMALGFEKAVATQAYFACDKNEELAANFLFDGGGDEPMPPA